ncbi:MAG: hypothetical protein NTW20_06900 [Rhodobacterales bacterium]|nr:hypothetical protein [Rhodobacterales bacterium]
MDGSYIQLLVSALIGWLVVYLGIIRPIRNIITKPIEQKKQRQLREDEVDAQRRIADALEAIAKNGKSDT